jgi:hypothetical protein
LMWTDRVDGKCCVVVSFADSAELPHSSSDEVVVSFAGLLWWTDGECCVLVSFADSTDEVVVPHSSSKSDSDSSDATLTVILCLYVVVVVVERKSHA